MPAINDAIAHAYQNAPAFARIMDAAGLHPDDIQNVDDLAKIPVLSKDRFQELQQEAPPFGGFLAVPLRELQRIYLSPGPIYDPHGLDDADVRQAGVEALHEAGFTPDDIAINTFLYHMVPAGLLLDQILRDIGTTVVPMGPGNTDFQVKVILDLGITAYVGTPSFLQMIYDKAGDQLPLQKAFFSAEMYTPSQRALFEGEYGLRTAQAYATADLGILAYERPGHSGLYIPQNLIMQICDPQTGDLLPDGEMGEVVVTSLNRAYPLIRFGTGDLSVMERESGDGSERRKLLGLMGRSGEAIKVRGMFLHPNALKGSLADFENIEKFQARVWREGSRDQVTLQLVLSGGSIDEQAVIDAVQAEARLSINAVELVEAIDGSRLVVDTRSYD
jgi:phenylacetate-CoA ligase